MKTFEEFVILEGEATHLVKYFAKQAATSLVPGAHQLRRYSTQKLIDKHNLHKKISKDPRLTDKEKEQHLAHAEKYKTALAAKMGDRNVFKKVEESSVDETILGRSASVAHHIQHYKTVWDRGVKSSYKRRKDSQHHVDRYQLHRKMADDTSLSLSVRDRSKKRMEFHKDEIIKRLSPDYKED